MDLWAPLFVPIKMVLTLLPARVSTICQHKEVTNDPSDDAFRAVLQCYVGDLSGL
jgi:hypothetical protein